jgi:hypothetical protein
VSATVRHETCVDGPGLARWVAEHRLDLRSLDLADRRALQRCRHAGHQVRLATADRILLRLGYLLGDLPREVLQPYDNGRTG